MPTSTASPAVLLQQDNSPSPLDAELVNDARSLGYSQEDAQTLVDALQTSRSVIAAKHAAYVDKPAQEQDA